ncbi:MAG: type II toxin-antitoxin system VapC family toxin [Actinomycetota bacterium]
MYVLDTNTLSYFFRGEGRIAERLANVTPSDIAIPTIVLFEIEAGIARSPEATRRRAQLDEALAVIQTLPFGRKEARSAARIRADLEGEGVPIGPYDVLIAGTVMANGATLVTRNEREFQRVAGLAVENWY